MDSANQPMVNEVIRFEMDGNAYTAAYIQGRKLYFAFILAFLDLEMA